jgi:hypothetical protein
VNSFAPIDPNLIDVVLPSHDGYPEELAAGDTRDVLFDVCGSASRSFPKALWIEPANWADKVRENDKYKTHPRNYRDRFTNQTPSHECVWHSEVAGMEACWNRQRGVIYPDGAKKDFRYEESDEFSSVWFSPLSGYSEAQPRQWGGTTVRGSLEIGVRRGVLPDKIQPRDYGFKHSLHGTTGKGGLNQSSGPWVPLSRFPDGWQETAKHFRILEVIFPESWEQAVCLVLHGMMVHVGRNGHAVPWCRWIPDQGMEYQDSYDVFRYDSTRTVKSAWQGSYAIASMTAPDDWSKPAG